jgi:glycosyltransferase involved in cell wall biosynthesis
MIKENKKTESETEKDKMPKKRRLLIATDGFLPRWDGIVRFLLEIIPRLEPNYEIKVLAPTFEGTYENPLKSEVIRFKQLKLKFGDIYFSRVSARKVKEHIKWADIVFVQSLGTIGIAVINAAHKKRPIIIFTHLIEWDIATKSLKRFKRVVNRLTKTIARRYYQKCDFIIHPTEEVKYLYAKNGIHIKSEIIPLGTDITKFTPPENKKEAKEKVGINPNHIIIGYHGRIGREKDLLTLYRAFRHIEKTNPDVRLMIVGRGVKEHERMFSSVRNIIMPGSQLNVVPYLQAMDIYVLSSLTETSSLGTMEAMACSLAIVTTPVGYVKNYITEKENGMTFPFGNSMRLALKLGYLIENEELRKKLGINARKTIEKEFNWDKTANKIQDVLKKF